MGFKGHVVGSLRSSSHLGLGSPSPRPSPPGEGEASEPDRIFIVHRLNPVEENRDTSVRWAMVFMDNSDFTLALTPALSPRRGGALEPDWISVCPVTYSSRSPSS